jgi:hypothetical protein
MRTPKGGILNLAAIECYKFIMHYAEKAGRDIIPDVKL